MFLLQAGITEAMIIRIVFFIFLVVGIPVVTIIIKIISRNYFNRQKQYDDVSIIKSKASKVLSTIASAVLATIIVIGLFLLIGLLFDKCNPDYSYGN